MSDENATKDDITRLHERLDNRQNELQEHIRNNIKDFGRMERLINNVTNDVATLVKAVKENSDITKENSKAILHVRLFQVKANLIFALLALAATGFLAIVAKFIYDIALKLAQ